jgi:hypothetical protein
MKNPQSIHTECVVTTSLIGPIRVVLTTQYWYSVVIAFFPKCTKPPIEYQYSLLITPSIHTGINPKVHYAYSVDNSVFFRKNIHRVSIRGVNVTEYRYQEKNTTEYITYTVDIFKKTRTRMDTWFLKKLVWILDAEYPYSVSIYSRSKRHKCSDVQHMPRTT